MKKFFDTQQYSKQQLGGLAGASASLYLAELATELNRPQVIVTEDSLTAQQLRAEIPYFLPAESKLDLCVFPDWETLPYDSFSPHQDIISERLASLYKISTWQSGILIVPIATLMQHICPQSHVLSQSFVLSKGDKLDLTEARRDFERRGYHLVQQVYSHGEFAVRGAILDIFPMGCEQPYRIDLFDNEVDSIRAFDPESQRSIETIDSLQLLPAREFPLTETSISHFRENWREKFPGNPTHCPIYQQISDGMSAAGIEYYLPLFFEQTVSLLDYLKDNTQLIYFGAIEEGAKQYWAEVKERYESCNIDHQKPLLKPEEICYTVEEIKNKLEEFDNISLRSKDYTGPKDIAINYKLDNPLTGFCDFIYQHPETRILICAESAGRQEVLIELLQKSHLQPLVVTNWSEFLSQDHNLCISIAPIYKSAELSLARQNYFILSESLLFGEQVQQRRRRADRAQTGIDSDVMVRNLAELNIGDAVVHIDYGVGRYLGLQTLDLETGNISAEYLTLEYANKDKLYVPVTSLQLISRYSGADLENAPLNKLGTNQWEKAKEKAQKQVRDVAAELLHVYAKRESREGYQYSAPDADYQKFTADFPFEETADQAKAITAVLEDMTSIKPMDRLICGDVGFGKTEVAMRAAFMAVKENKQVGMLVPTTLLAQQHFNSFQDRFANWPVSIELISRFRSKSETEKVLEKLAEGKIDILIGTHKLIQENVNFKQLGLLIIDEEHRFGVRQKETLKKLRSEVDILTLTATPIPRTLNMSLSGMRELSIIATPPAKRLSINTFVHERNNSLIREAIMREILRGGQVYFLHNNVETIAKTCDDIQALVPEARVSFAHGQMRERELESVMRDFYHQRFNVLVCTTIIETGIDIPTANTIIMDRADKLGLAQLHQLRGRVGRSHHQAYAYLMTPNKKTLTKDAKKRLDAISKLEDLGVGFSLATHDLEIRGAGEILGEGQSGNIQTIGFSLYMELLEKSVNALKAGKEINLDSPLQTGAEIDLQVPCLIPEDYIHDVHERLILYKRIANTKNQKQLDDLQVEMIDRFGLLPEYSKNLFAITELRQLADDLGVRKISTAGNNGRLDFTQETRACAKTIINLIQTQALHYKLEGPSTLKFSLRDTNGQARISLVAELLTKLRGDQSEAPH